MRGRYYHLIVGLRYVPNKLSHLVKLLRQRFAQDDLHAEEANLFL
jgi:hypothetical protein